MEKTPPSQGGEQSSARRLQIMSELLGAVIAISSQHEKAIIAREACNQILYLLNVDSCAISMWNRDNDTVELLTESELNPSTTEQDWYTPYPLQEYPATRSVLENGQAMQIRIDDPAADDAEKQLLINFESQAMLMLPLVAEGQVIGLAELLDFNKPRVFSNEEIALVYLLLNQVGIMIERTELMEDTRQRADELELLRKASFNLVTSEDMETITQIILDTAVRIFPKATGIYVFQHSDGILNFETSFIPAGGAPGAWAELHNNGMVVSVANTGNIMLIPDFSKHPLFRKFPQKYNGTVVGIPIKTGEQVFAVIVIRFPEVCTIPESTMRIIQLFSDQAAVAIERNHNMQEIRRRVFELEALRQTSLALTSSLNLDEVLQSILKSVLYLSKDAMDAHLFLYEDGRLSFGAALWADSNYQGLILQPRQDGFTMKVAKEGAVIAVPNMQNHPLFKGESSDDPNMWRGGIVGLPLKSGDDVIGVMNVAYRTPRQFTRDNLRVLGLLSDQASLAIANARLHQSITRQARTDALTGLANRRAFNQFLEDEINRAERYDRTFSVLMMDLDGFKNVNDTFGHLQGDMVLKSVAASLTASIRESDFLARWGGDEFILLLPETELSSAHTTASKLSRAISDKTFTSLGPDLPPLVLHLTMGVVNFPQHGKTARQLLQTADSLLYKGKKKRSKN